MNGVEVVASWLTPTVLFCFLNLMIGTIFFRSTLNPQRKPQNLGENSDGQPPQLARVPSFLERVKSINLSRYQSQQSDPAEEHVARPDIEPEELHHVVRTKSATVTKTKPVRVLKKSASEKVTAEKVEVDEQRPATVRERSADDEAVDAKADDFINKFRQQLKLQRVDSILRYKEMLNRGTAR